MKDNRGGAGRGQGNKPLPFKTQFVKKIITGQDFKRLAKEGESYEEFFQRIKGEILKEIDNILIKRIE